MPTNSVIPSINCMMPNTYLHSCNRCSLFTNIND